MQTRADNALLARCQPGNLLTMQQLVRQYQDELLRTAYLLTGVSSSAITLTATAFLDLFQALPRSTTDRDARIWLLTLMGRACLAGRLASEDLSSDLPPDSSRTPDQLAGSGPQQYQVDDERSRVLAALARLDRRTRVALVLAEFSGLDDSAVSRITGQPMSELRNDLQQAKTRVAEAAGRNERQLRGPLSNVATAAPRVDLWPLMVEPLGQIEERNRRRSQLLIGGMAAVAGLVLIAGLVWLFAADAFNDQQPDQSASGTVPVVTVANTVESEQTEESDADQDPTPDSSVPPGLSSFTIGVGELPAVQVITSISYDSDRRGNSTASVLLTDQYAQVKKQLGDAGFLGGISPDGRWLLFVQNVWNEKYPDGQMTITAFDTRANLVAWQKEYESSIWFTQGGAALAITPEQAYLSDSDGYLVALNLATGLETGRWRVLLPEGEEPAEGDDVNWSVNRSVRLYVAPNQRRLFAFVETFDNENASWSRAIKAFNLPGMTEASAMTEIGEFDHNDRWQTDFAFWSAVPALDGSNFYTLMNLEDEGFVVRFLDLRSNELTDVELPIAFSPSSTFPTMIQSNSGRWLYFIHGETLQVTIVDILNRRLDRTFRLDGNGFDLPVLSSTGNNGAGYGLGVNALSQDGETLYLTMVDLDNQHQPPKETIVLAIDVRTWRVTDHWVLEGQINQIYVHPDGDLVTVSSVTVYPSPSVNQFESFLLTFDRYGNQVEDSVDVQALIADETYEYSFVFSLSDGYKRQYGLAPVVGGIPPADAILESTLPRVEIAASQEEVAAGNTTEIIVRFTDPATGEMLTSSRPDVRLDLDAGVFITLSHHDADPVLVQPVQLEDGSYRAIVHFEEPGAWSATASMSYGDGTRWSTTNSRVVEVIQTFIASDGKRYVPKLTTDPEQPQATEDIVVQIEFRDTTNGLLIPEDVDLPEGLPDNMQVSFVNLTHGVTSVTLEQAGHGIYQGSEAFRDAGEWSANLRFKIDDRRVSMTGGSVIVGALPVSK